MLRVSFCVVYVLLLWWCFLAQVLFVTSSDRPFSESERTFLDLIGRWGKKVIFVVNKIDILPDDTSVDEVIRKHTPHRLSQNVAAPACGSNRHTLHTLRLNHRGLKLLCTRASVVVTLLVALRSLSQVCAFVAKNGAAQLRASLGKAGGDGEGVVVLPVSAKLALRAKISAPAKRSACESSESPSPAPTSSSSSSSSSSSFSSSSSSSSSPPSSSPSSSPSSPPSPSPLEVVDRHAPELGAGARHWQASRFGELERVLFKALTERERVVFKLLSPLGVADRLLASARGRNEDRGRALEADLATVRCGCAPSFSCAVLLPCCVLVKGDDACLCEPRRCYLCVV